MKNFNKLSRAEMKNVLGGDDPILDGGGGNRITCSCTGSVGSWYYTDTPTDQQVADDIKRYCSSGQGSC